MSDVTGGSIVAIAAVIGAVVLIAAGYDHGWGWLLLLAFLVAL